RGAQWTRSRGSVSLSAPAHAAGGEECAPLRPPECPPACKDDANGDLRGCAIRSGILGALVRRLEVAGKRERAGQGRSGARTAGRGAAADVAVDDRLAPPRTARSWRRSRVNSPESVEAHVVKMHKTLKMTPALAANVSQTPSSIGDLV